MCKRVQRLSGEERCAIHVKATTLAAHHKEFDTKQISGSSPPGVFVGRFGYPKVFVGPMVPPVSGDTEILDTPEGREIDRDAARDCNDDKAGRH